ncbi:MAG TPA: cytochrome b [Rhodanobacteraceae bacterium]|nr:cytochrome b [Rhodanobacteraceae bacterium]
MPTPPRPERWNAIAQLMHWLIAALILVQGVLGLVMVEMPKRPAVIPYYNTHKSIGLTILALVVLRLAWRLLATRRPALPPMPRWQTGFAETTHVLLYVLIFAVPLSGWLFDSASSLRPLHWWGVVKMPSLTGGPDADLKAFAHGLHVSLFWCLVGVAALHVAGALKHHFIDRDNVLRAMLPGRNTPRRTP